MWRSQRFRCQGKANQISCRQQKYRSCCSDWNEQIKEDDTSIRPPIPRISKPRTHRGSFLGLYRNADFQMLPEPPRNRDPALAWRLPFLSTLQFDPEVVPCLYEESSLQSTFDTNKTLPQGILRSTRSLKLTCKGTTSEDFIT